jgi:alkylation response protein AidB-like acyl-CoA dehydrogenase
MIKTLTETEIGRIAADAVTEIARRAVNGAPLYSYVDSCPLTWSAVEEGGWDFIGASEAHGGGDATMRDLVEVGKAWGSACIPLPLMESIWAKRWSLAARAVGGPVSLSVPRVQQGDKSSLAPFGALADVGIARSIGRDDSFDRGPVGLADPFAPSLCASILPYSTDIPDEAAYELAVIWAAEAVGAAQTLVDLSVQYAKDREQFGQPIGSFQAIKHRLADMHSDAEYAETAVIWASAERDQAERATRYAIDTSIRIAESAIQVHGGMGFTWELGLHFYLRAMLTQRHLLCGLWAGVRS